MTIPRFFRTVVGVVGFLVVGVLAVAQDAGAKKDGHLGTWKLVSTKYGDEKEFRKRGEDSERIKHITATHFTWIEVITDSKTIQSGAGGKYTLEGTVYTETIEYAGQGMEAFVGKPQKFTIKVDGDKLHQSGVLSNGLKIEENWERMK
ncbi:MAG TPA: hypothetical protein VF773_21950 [Verrucomicrobiae bacterium]